MTSYPNLGSEPEKLNMKTRDDEIKDLKYKTEKRDYENMVKSLKNNNDYYRKKNESLMKKKVFKIVSEFLIGSVGLSVGSGLTVSGFAPIGFMCASSISFFFIKY